MGCTERTQIPEQKDLGTNSGSNTNQFCGLKQITEHFKALLSVPVKQRQYHLPPRPVTHSTHPVNGSCFYLVLGMIL